MRVGFTFRNLEPSEGIKTYATEKIGKLQKYVRAPLEADVTVSTERHLHCADVMVHADGRRYAARDESEDMYASIDVAIDRIDRQLRDAKATANTRKRHSVGAAEVGQLAELAKNGPAVPSKGSE